ncbi:sulfite exporter TauE/SafE family protein [Mycetocola tolaasinivorans]|uniref:Probable membrane transporter protein n=1 Tax=Mycetocola tolaasinivorans TaxID=76635 RepID=A0A3L7A775_9MICO|nr:sulfite exporter TauE/SafE family protein [Mycetocola tolaasinivorans]RLP75738.1 sulfite exporter TauE/SafE family protein [Mycetocola tolaasinivorans]
MSQTGSRRVPWLIAIGLAAGFLSGLFGVGGGILVVPALIFLVSFENRLAAGTSLAAIVPTSLVGVITYAASGSVDWWAGLILAAGSVVGAQLGAFLLSRIPKRALQWAFIAFLVVVIVQLFLVVPVRGAEITLHPWSIVGLVALGLLTGVLSGLLGIGGGIIIVPMLVMLFGASDLLAKGTSLLMMIPTAISGTVGNVIRRNVDLPAAAFVGVSACLTTTLGAQVARLLSPEAGNILFAAFIAVIVVRMVLQILRERRTH